MKHQIIAPSLCFEHDVNIDSRFVAVGANCAFSERFLHGQLIKDLRKKMSNIISFTRLSWSLYRVVK
jgi:hypothetical protein